MGTVNEAGILRLACRAEGLKMFQLVCASSLLVGEHEIFTFELRTSTEKQIDIAKEAETKFGISPVDSMPYKVC